MENVGGLIIVDWKPAEAFVTSLSDGGHVLAVGTSSTLQYFQLKTRHHPWFSRFSAVISADHPEVRELKPAPDIFLAAARAIGGEPARCLVIEDSPAGVLAARAAGILTFGASAAAATLFEQLAWGEAGPDGTKLLRRWAGDIEGRGACRFPDGAVRFLRSALNVFADDLHRHAAGYPCAAADRAPLLPIPRQEGSWR